MKKKQLLFKVKPAIGDGKLVQTLFKWYFCAFLPTFHQCRIISYSLSSLVSTFTNARLECESNRFIYVFFHLYCCKKKKK